MFNNITKIIENSKLEIFKEIDLHKDDRKQISIDNICINWVPDYENYYYKFVKLSDNDDNLIINNIIINGETYTINVPNIKKNNNIFKYKKKENKLVKSNPELNNIKIINFYVHKNEFNNILFGYDNYFNFIIYLLDRNNKNQYYVKFSYYLMWNTIEFPLICFYNNMNNYSELLNNDYNNKLLDNISTNFHNYENDSDLHSENKLLIKSFFDNEKNRKEPASTRLNLGMNNYRNYSYNYKFNQLIKFRDVFFHISENINNIKIIGSILKEKEIEDLKKDKLYTQALLTCIESSKEEYKQKYFKENSLKEKISAKFNYISKNTDKTIAHYKKVILKKDSYIVNNNYTHFYKTIIILIFIALFIHYYVPTVGKRMNNDLVNIINFIKLNVLIMANQIKIIFNNLKNLSSDIFNNNFAYDNYEYL